MAEREYDVARVHEGDKLYLEGAVRTLDEAAAKHLVDLGVLVPRAAGAAVKAEPNPLNKAETAAPANKADDGRKAKQKADKADQGDGK